ncbi:MAG: flagellar motor switch protein FliG [Bryobacteraceae bacterium]
MQSSSKALPSGDKSSMPGVRKAAIILTTVGENTAAAILRHLREDEIHDIAREISRLPAVNWAERKIVLEEFAERIAAPAFGLPGDIEQVTKMLVAAFGQEAGQRLSERVLRSLGNNIPNLDLLQKCDPQQLAKVIHGEHPQTIALILSHLGCAKAAELLAALPAEVRPIIIKRMALLDQISPDVITRISRSISSKLRMLGESSREAYGGVRAVADVLNLVEGSISDDVLTAVSESDQGLGDTIRHLMFVFDDLAKIDQNSLRALLAKVDRKVLTLALKGCTPQTKQAFTSCMSQRGAEMLAEDMDALGPVRLRDVDGAQQQILSEASKLQKEGVITLKASAGEKFVV